MVITVADNKGQKIIKFGPDLILANIDEVKYEISIIIKEVDPVAIDLSQVENCDTAGVQLLYSLYLNLIEQNRTFVITKDSPGIKRAFARLGLSAKIFEKKDAS